MRNECSIVRDILLLYVENMVSADNASFIAEHFENCSACREEMLKLGKSTEIADTCKIVTTSDINQAASLKAVKKAALEADSYYIVVLCSIRFFRWWHSDFALLLWFSSGFRKYQDGNGISALWN